MRCPTGCERRLSRTASWMRRTLSARCTAWTSAPGPSWFCSPAMAVALCWPAATAWPVGHTASTHDGHCVAQECELAVQTPIRLGWNAGNRDLCQSFQLFQEDKAELRSRSVVQVQLHGCARTCRAGWCLW